MTKAGHFGVVFAALHLIPWNGDNLSFTERKDQNYTSIEFIAEDLYYCILKRASCILTIEKLSYTVSSISVEASLFSAQTSFCLS